MDLVPVDRMRRLLQQQPAIVNRVFTADEQRYCERRRAAVQHYAARFAAKEAVVKALGTGLAQGMRWTDVEVVRDRDGRPLPRLHGRVAMVAIERRMRSLEVSLSHTSEIAIAQAVALFDPEE